jgi:hypothetical protein
MAPFDATDVVTPLIERLPSHGHIFGRRRRTTTPPPGRASLRPELDPDRPVSPFGPSRKGECAMGGFRYELRLADGDDAGTFETSSSDWKVGDTLIADGNRHYRVTASCAARADRGVRQRCAEQRARGRTCIGSSAAM